MADESPQSSGYGKRPLWQWVLLYVVIAAILYGLIYYFVFHKNSYSTAPSGYASPTLTSAPTSQPSTSSASPSTTGAVQVTVTGTEFTFSPSVITVKKGQTVQVTFKNAGTFPHNFTLSDLGVKTATIQPGQTTSITFTANKAGSFTYICTVPGHADRGMKGTLTVE